MANKVVLNGDLKFLGLGDVLQLIGSNGSTGMLRINAKYSPEPGIIYFKSGNVINASTPDLNGLDAAFALFGWMEGDYEFIECPVDVEKSIKTPRMEIILDGLRLMDDGVTPILGPVTEDRTSKSGLPVINGPLPDYMYVLAEEDFFEGREIVRENRFGNWIWVVMDGVVDVLKEAPDGPLTLLKLGTGAYLGGLSSFSFRGNTWPVTIMTATRVQLGVVDAQKLMEEFETCTPIYRDMVQSMDRRRTDLFQNMTNIHSGQERIKDFIEGRKRIIKQGKPDESLGRITAGNAFVVRKTEKYGRIPLATLNVGDFFGAFPLLDMGHEPARASVYVSSDFEHEPMDTELLAQEHEDTSYALKSMIEGLATQISIATRVAEDFRKKVLGKRRKAKKGKGHGKTG